MNGIFRGSAVGGGTDLVVGVSGQLAVGDQVTARQRLCDHVSRPSKPVVVQEFLRPLAPDRRQQRRRHPRRARSAAPHREDPLLRRRPARPGLNASGDVDHTRLFDCATHAITTVTGLPGNSDLFCSGHAQLADGRILAAGGTRKWGGGGIHPPGHFIGLRDAYLFDPAGPSYGKRRASSSPSGPRRSRRG